MMSKQLYPQSLITQTLQASITATVNMAGLDIDPEIIRARLGVICEIAESFGVAGQLRVPCVAGTMLKSKLNRVLDCAIK